MAKTLISWYEPVLFVPRLRTFRGWMWRLAWMIGLSVLTYLFLHFVRGGLPFTSELKTAFLVGLILPLLPDVLHFQRDLWISDEAIEWVAGGGRFRLSGSFPHRQTVRIDFFRPGEWEHKHGGMQIHVTSGDRYLIGIPHQKKLETLATILTRLEIPVRLSGWEPTTDDSRTRIADEVSLADLPTSTRDAVFAAISPEEPRLRTTLQMVVGGFISGGPLLLGLIGMIGTWVYLGMNWRLLAPPQKWAIGLGGVAGFVLSFLFLLLIGQFIEQAYLIAEARKQLRNRLHPSVNPEDDDVYAVSIYRREIWSNVAAWADDFGFLQVNRRQRTIVFEGDKERWSIPLTALTVLRVEEAQVGKEGSESPETRYFVVLGTFRESEEWEIGLIWARTKWGHDNGPTRRERMGVLFNELRTAVSLA